ncbi:MAG TPA: histidinol-phosphate transaminase [Terriglobales bacterium]|nr:histidinol-phosphate transaminase [Terriglobales bacterium]
MLRPREAVLTLKEYHPPLGGRVGLRMDFNENTAGCSPRVLQKLREIGPDLLAKYPEREPVEAIVAEFLGINATQLLLTNGVDEAIHLLCQAFVEAGEEVLIAVPTFSMYEVYASAAGARVVTVQADDDFAFPLERLLQAITARTKLIAIANPNNPTGTAVKPATLLRIAEAAPHAAVLVDEAYFEFHGQSFLPQMQTYENVFIARTFSKAYGLAGLRVGVLAGAPEPMRMVRCVSSPYNVNAIALAALPEALGDREYVVNYVQQVQQGRERLQCELRDLGVQYWPSEANFVLARFGVLRKAFVAAMRERGVLVRDRNSDPGCEGCVRITAGTVEQMELVIAAVRSSLEVARKQGAGEMIMAVQQ